MSADETNRDEQQRLRDLGGDIGKGDTTAGGGDPDRQQPAVDPSVMAVDSLPDDTRTGSFSQDETELVQQGEELRPAPDGAPERVNTD